jgi:uncharacterized integral membrane protein
VSDPMMPSGGSPPPRRDRRRDVRLVLTGVVAVLLVWFALINLQDVQIHFWLTSAKSPLIVVIVISGVLGVAIALLSRRLAGRRRHPDGDGLGGPGA